MSFAHFIAAQDPVWSAVLAELARGRKETHWMWFVFPQIAGIGYSPASQRFALASVDTARSYLAKPILRARLEEATTLTLSHADRSLEAIFGSVDAMKFHASMTLFHHAAPDAPLFSQALDRFCHGKPHDRTIALIGG